jgi:hypothetical protein
MGGGVGRKKGIYNKDSIQRNEIFKKSQSRGVQEWIGLEMMAYEEKWKYIQQKMKWRDIEKDS